MSNFLQALMPDILLNYYFGTNIHLSASVVDSLLRFTRQMENLTLFGARWDVRLWMETCCFGQKVLVNVPNMPGDWDQIAVYYKSLEVNGGSCGDCRNTSYLLE